MPLIHGTTEVAGRLLMACTMCLQIMSVTFQRVAKSVVCSWQVAVPAADGSEVMEEYGGLRKQREWPGQVSALRPCSPGRRQPHAPCASLSSQAGPLLQVFAFLLSPVYSMDLAEGVPFPLSVSGHVHTCVCDVCQGPGLQQ